MVERTLNLASIVAKWAGAAGVPGAGGAGALIGASLDSTDLWRSPTAENTSTVHRLRP